MGCSLPMLPPEKATMHARLHRHFQKLSTELTNEVCNADSSIRFTSHRISDIPSASLLIVQLTKYLLWDLLLAHVDSHDEWWGNAVLVPEQLALFGAELTEFVSKQRQGVRDCMRAAAKGLHVDIAAKCLAMLTVQSGEQIEAVLNDIELLDRRWLELEEERQELLRVPLPALEKLQDLRKMQRHHLSLLADGGLVGILRKALSEEANVCQFILQDS